MYPTSNSVADSIGNCTDDNACSKWKNLLVGALGKVQKQVHNSLSIVEDALEYIENLILKLLDILCACQPHCVQDVEDRVSKTFPHPIDKWAISDAQSAQEKRKRNCPLVLPVDRIHQLLKEKLGYKIDHAVTVYIVAVLEYIAADILKLTGNYVKNIKHEEITLQDIKVAMCADKVLMDMFFQDDDDDAFTVEEEKVVEKIESENKTYEDIIKDLILDETQYMRDLNMIIKVFREPFARLFPTSKDIENIFSNIVDVQALTYNLLSSLEDTKEMCEETDIPLVGACFEDIAEGAEFDVYSKYTEDSLRPLGRERLQTLLERQDVNSTLEHAGQGFKDAVRYVLPKLLMGPIHHCLRYFDVLVALSKTSPDEDDCESINNAKSMMHRLKADIERKLAQTNQLKRSPGEINTLRFQGRAEKDAALNKMNELQKSIDGWDGKNISQICHEFVMEGILQKYAGRRLAERCVFLLDALIIFTKPNMRRSSVTTQAPEYRLKDKYQIRRIDVIDKPNTEEVKNSFELHIREHPNIILVAKTAEEKANWMASLISLLKRSMLERMLDTKISEETRKTPLKLPSPDVYRFAEEDSDNNVVFEEQRRTGSTEGPQIKGGTLVKLVERLTYHTYGEPKFLRTFLTTYRTFCKPVELLDLLIERFDIIEPAVEVDETDPEGALREDLKRFRKEYTKPVRFRVLNVLRHWVDQHWYDFHLDRDLLAKLHNFLDAVKGKAMRKWVESVNKIINRKLESDGVEKPKEIIFPNNSAKPKIEWHLEKDPTTFDLMNLHPIEIARQVTLLEFDLYRAVKPSELVGTVWMKKQKHLTSANLLKMINHSTRFTFWLEKCIIESGNIEERVAVVARILEIMMVFQELNNFNGILEVVGALNSAPVYRLEHTFEEVDQKHHKLKKAFDEAKELNSDHFKKYYEKLRSINPPCVPFLGNYLTNILLTEEGNPDFLPNRPDGIINFSKRRKVAEICGEIQQYQNQPYCLDVESSLRHFFEELKPLEGKTEKEFNDCLYAKSLELEPRNSKQPAKFDKKRDYPLKSPGIKPVSSRHGSSSTIPKSTLERPSITHSYLRLNDESGQTDTPVSSPPHTPSTPLTPPHETKGSEAEFALVNLPVDRDSATIGMGSFPSSTFSSPKTLTGAQEFPLSPPPRRSSVNSVNLRRDPPRMELRMEPRKEPTVIQPVNRNIGHAGAYHSQRHPPPPPLDLPPPLPPRKKRDSSGNELSPVKLTPTDEAAPPLPPRRQSHTTSALNRQFGIDPLTHTLPRNTARIPYHHNAMLTLPRRNSERDYLGAQPPFVNVNGERGGSVTPELPPKMYNKSVSHSRQQSS